MDWEIWGIIGWCGTAWPHRFGGIGGSDTDPDWPWPNNCPACNGFIGFLSAVLVSRIANLSPGLGFFEAATVAFAAGAVGSQVVGNVVGMFRAK